jgi:drug/metabolite transporter (DMT)-like permease
VTTPAERRWAFALTVIAPLLWSVNYIVGRLAPGQIAPHALALGRWALAGLLLALLARRELARLGRWTPDEWRQAFVLGLLGMWICGAWVYVGAQTTQATNIALIYALSPVFIAIGAATFLHEHLRPSQWFGALLALIGLVHVVIKGQWAQLAAVQFVVGDLWILAAAVSWSVYSILLKRWPSRFSPMARLVMIITGGVLLLVPLAAVEAWAAWRWNLAAFQTQWDLRTVLLVLAVALFPGAGAYLAHATITRHLGAARAALTLYLGPLAGAATAWVFLGEAVQSHHLVGAAVILPGIWLASRSGSG